MKNKRIAIGLLILVIVAIAAYFMFSKQEEKTPEDNKVEDLLKTQQERSDSMKRALGIE